jgi:hypothetical protein
MVVVRVLVHQRSRREDVGKPRREGGGQRNREHERVGRRAEVITSDAEPLWEESSQALRGIGPPSARTADACETVTSSRTPSAPTTIPASTSPSSENSRPAPVLRSR